jgi:hypothetical protein
MASRKRGESVPGLQKKIRQAGEGVYGVRLSSAGCICLPVATLMIVAILGDIIAGHSLPLAVDVVLMILVTGTAIAIPGLLARADRRIRVGSLKRDLRRLAPGKRMQTLLPIAQRKEGDASKIALQLARHLDIHPEVAPAAPPDVRGDEASPAEQP